MHIVALPLVQAVESLYVQMLKSQQQLLRMKAATLPEVTVPHVGLCALVGNSLARATQYLELDTLHMQKDILQLRMGITPLVTIKRQRLFDIVSPPLETAMYYFESSMDCLGKQILSLHEHIARDAAKAVRTRQQPIASPTHLQTKKEPSWDERLWQHIVMRAKQIPDEGDIAKTVFLACSQMWSIYPQLTLHHFAYILKKHSKRTDEEKSKILAALKTIMAEKAHGLPVSHVAAKANPATDAPVAPSTGVPEPFEQGKQDALAPVQATPARGMPIPQGQTVTPAQPSVPPVRPVNAKPTYDQRITVRKAFEQVLCAQNLPHDTLQEKKAQVLSAALALWKYNPHLKFTQVERVLHYYVDFTMADAAAMAEVLKLHAPARPEQVTLHDSAEDTPALPRASDVEEDSDEPTDSMHR